MPGFQELFAWLSDESVRPRTIPSLPLSICRGAAHSMVENLEGQDGQPSCHLTADGVRIDLDGEARALSLDHLSRSVWCLCRRHPPVVVEYLIGRIAYSWHKGSPAFEDLTSEELLMWLNAALFVLRSDQAMSSGVALVHRRSHTR